MQIRRSHSHCSSNRRVSVAAAAVALAWALLVPVGGTAGLFGDEEDPKRLVPAVGDAISLEVQLPRPGLLQQGHDKILVSGKARLPVQLQYEIMLAIDASASTRRRTHVEIGGKRVFRDSSEGLIDLDRSELPTDSIFMKQIEAARRFVEELNPEQARIGLIRMSGESGFNQQCERGPAILQNPACRGYVRHPTAELVQGLTNDMDLVRLGLDRIERQGVEGETLYDNAISIALAQFRETWGRPGIRPILIMLSDGMTEETAGYKRALKAAEEQARKAAKWQVPVHAYHTGDLISNPALSRMVAITSGKNHRLTSQKVIDANLIELAFDDVAVQVVNRTNGAHVQELSINQNGVFQGFLYGEQGRTNVIDVVAVSSDGRSRTTKTIEVLLADRKRYATKKVLDTSLDDEIAALEAHLEALTRQLRQDMCPVPDGRGEIRIELE